MSAKGPFLKPCPSGHKRARTHYLELDATGSTEVTCDDYCHWIVWGESEAEAVKRWNDRQGGDGE